MPTLYKGNMFIRTGSDTARVKVYHRKDWVWLDVLLCKQDVKYIEKHCLSDPNTVQKNPKLKKCGKCWYLVFPFAKAVTFEDVAIEDRTICAIDLGINQNAVCSIMQSDGTVVARKFINFATEKDHLYKALGRQKKAQQHGNRKTPVLWKRVNDINQDISRKTAKGIMDFAILYNVDVIVFEYLDTNGKNEVRRNNACSSGENGKSSVLWNIMLTSVEFVSVESVHGERLPWHSMVSGKWNVARICRTEKKNIIIPSVSSQTERSIIAT